MPSFSVTLNDTQMWQLALFVANADKLPDSAKSLLVPLVPDAPTAAMPAMVPTMPNAAATKK
jgi:hypothetical protein